MDYHPDELLQYYHFSVFAPLMRDHLSFKTTKSGPIGWSYITGFTVFTTMRSGLRVVTALYQVTVS